MDDLISRQMAIDAVEESRRLNNHKNGKEAISHEYEHRHFLKILRDLPSAEPKWISVEQKLPDNDNTVLITHRGGVSFGWYNGRYWERGASTNHRKLQTVIAWMPLPEPYKDGENG